MFSLVSASCAYSLRNSSFTVTLDTVDLSGHIALTGSPTQLIELLARMTQALTEIATARGQLPTSQAPTQPAEPATTGR